MSTLGREADAQWYRKRYRETGDKKYLRLAEETEAWLCGDSLTTIFGAMLRAVQGDDR
jgi:hypothetical protein